MRRQAPFAAAPTSPEAAVRRLQSRRQRIDEHNLARSFGLPERHARKLRLLAERAKQADRSNDPPDDNEAAA